MARAQSLRNRERGVTQVGREVRQRRTFEHACSVPIEQRTIRRVKFADFSRAPAHARSGRLHWADAAVLTAVGVVVLLVSLPRLREFALRENEADARRLTARLGELCESPQTAPARDLGALLAAEQQLLTRLDDVDWLENGALLRRHGYLFGLASDGRSIVAWPWEHGRTGLSAYRSSREKLEGHPNPGGAWSGLASPPRPSDDDPLWRTVAP